MDERDKVVALELGRRIRRLRRAAVFTQATVAKKASLHSNTISRLELGRGEMRTSTLIQICGALEIDPGDFMDGIEWDIGSRADESGAWRFDTSPDGHVPADRNDAHSTDEAPR